MKIWKKIKQFFCWLAGSKKRQQVHYLCGNEQLPLPLNQEEEAATIQQLSNGDKGARSTLIERNLRLVVYIARKFDNTGMDIDDLISIGTVGLIKAVGSFDSSKNIKLATYASRCIENEILMSLRKVVRTRSDVSLDEPLNVDFEGNELLLSDILGTDPDTVSKNLETSVEKQLLYEAIGQLRKREKEIMKMRFGLDGKDERTQKEVADMLGISQSYISRLEKKIISRLKKHIGKAI
ncbi:MAG: RNA polymerase sporulation sigma factor SigE [Firmicutes bacterium]|nr:RNA polymerase sporulation sigma factor SigE [Bacillota bacterium]